MAGRKVVVITANNLRDVSGPGVVVNTRHEGPTKRPTERAERLDEFTNKTGKKPSDLAAEAKRAAAEKAERERREWEAEQARKDAELEARRRAVIEAAARKRAAQERR